MGDWFIVNKQLSNNDELYHYGVIGMKWGIRKAKKQGLTYNYKSTAQKHYEKKVAKLKQKGASAKKIAKQETMLETTKLRDSRRQAYAERTSLGKIFLQSLLTGGSGRVYATARASGAGRALSYVSAIHNTLSRINGGSGGDKASRNYGGSINNNVYRYELRRAYKDVKKRDKK